MDLTKAKESPRGRRGEMQISCGNNIGKEAVTMPLGDAQDSKTHTRIKVLELS